MSGILGSLFGGNDQTVTTSTSNLRPQAEALAGNFFARTQAFADQPYQAYSGPRDAGFTPDQYAAFNAARNISGQAGDIYNQMRAGIASSNLPANIATSQNLASGIAGVLPGSEALLPGQTAAAQQAGALAGYAPNIAQQGASAALGLAQAFPGADIQAYMNPYTQAVLDPALEDISRRAAVERNALRSQQARTGAFGGSRGAIAEQEQERNVMGELGRTSATERARAYTEAANQYRLDQQNIPALYNSALSQLGSAQTLQRNAIDATNQALAGRTAVQQQGLAGQQGLSNVAQAEAQRQSMLQGLAAQNQGLLQSQVNPLLATGGLQQALSQAQMDRAYQDFIDQRDWQTRGLAAQQRALGIQAASQPTSTTQVSNPPNANPVGQVLGGSLGLLTAAPSIIKGAEAIGGAFSSLFKQGGLVSAAR